MIIYCAKIECANNGAKTEYVTLGSILSQLPIGSPARESLLSWLEGSS